MLSGCCLLFDGSWFFVVSRLSYFFLAIACGLRVDCLLLGVCWRLLVVGCLLFVVGCSSFGACRLLSGYVFIGLPCLVVVVCCRVFVLFVVCCLLFAVCCMLFVVCCSLCVVGCVLSVVC